MIANIVYMIIAISCIEISTDINIPIPAFWAVAASFLTLIVYLTIVKIVSSFLDKKAATIVDNRGVQESYNQFNTIFTTIAILSLCLHLLFFNSVAQSLQHSNIALLHFTRKIYGLFIFFTYVSIFWYIFSKIYNRAFDVNYTAKNFLKQNLRLYIPLSVPYLLIIALEEIFAFLPISKHMPTWMSIDSWIFSFVFVILFFLFLPPLVLRLWGCKKLESERIKTLEKFLIENGFSYKGIYTWPIFEGKILTAGIIGPVPWLRYILITESILDALTDEELKAVMAHEMAHAKLKHMWLYLLILFLFSSFLWNCQDTIAYFVFWIVGLFDPSLFIEGSKVIEITTVFIYLLLIFFFLRYVFGYFMRNFERQADLFAARLAGSRNIIGSLEKIAFLSGRSKDLPSWHHFSIAERIDAVRNTEKDSTYYRAHNKKLVISFAIFLLFLGLGFYAKQSFNFNHVLLLDLYSAVIEEELKKAPDNPKLLLALAQISHEKGDEKKAETLYEQVLLKNPNEPLALNNLAWIILKRKESDSEISRALELAQRAVEMERQPAFLDTLAEAYFAKGDREEAIKWQEEALFLSKGTKDEKAFREKLTRFQKALDTQSKPTQ